MAYRDDLEAAHARIQALEAELDEARRARLEALGERERRLDEALRAREGALPTLCDHNRSIPPRPTGMPADVSCPLCLLFYGERIEMMIAGNIRLVIWDERLQELGPTDQTVRCPSCRYTAIKM